MDNQKVTFRISLADIRPEALPVSDLSKVLQLAEDLIVPIIEADGGDASALVLALVGIESGSNVLDFWSSDIGPTRDALARVITSIDTGKYLGLPTKSRNAIEELHQEGTRLKTRLRLIPNPADDTMYGELDPHIELKQDQERLLKGETVIYGELFGIGGKEPKARITLDEGYNLPCEVSAEFAKKLASRLYTRVGLRGIAIWDVPTFTIASFKAIEILEYVQTSLSDALESVTLTVGHTAWDDVDDVSAEVHHQRRGDDE